MARCAILAVRDRRLGARERLAMGTIELEELELEQPAAELEDDESESSPVGTDDLASLECSFSESAAAAERDEELEGELEEELENELLPVLSLLQLLL
jgi:hypothetical protein